MFGDGRFNGTMQNVVGLTLVDMTTKFALGAEIQSPTGLLVDSFVRDSRSDFSKSTSPIFTKFRTDVQHLC